MPLSETGHLRLFIERAPYVLPVRIERRNIINRTVQIQGRRVHLRNGIVGQCDAFALVRGGGHVELETKAAKGQMRAAQERWRAWCASWGIPHLVLKARAKESPGDVVNRWIQELAEVCR